MRNQTIRLFLYSSLAIVLLTLAWGFKQIPQTKNLAESALKNSLEQEVLTLGSAVRSSTQALRFKLLDILKAEGNDRPTRAFQDSIFVAASLVEWDQNFWKPLWHSSKSKEGFSSTQFKEWVKNWPLAKINSGEVFFVKVPDELGQAHFAVVVPVRKPNGIPMVGIGVFPASQFGLSLSADRTREVEVFDDQGFALALSRPAYLGTSLKNESLIEQMLEGGEVSARSDWKNDAGIAMTGVSQRMSDSNLSIALVAPVNFGSAWLWQAWLYLGLCALGAVGLNWYLLNSLMKPLFAQLTQSDAMIEQLKRAQTGVILSAPAVVPAQTSVVKPELEDYSFIEPVAQPAPKAIPRVSLAKIVGSALHSLDSRMKEYNVRVQQTGLEGIELSGDVLQLQTALEEVLKNAIEAMAQSEQRWLTILGELRGSKVHLTIEDTGSGIPEENLDQIFDPFFSTKDAEGVSRGLGLNVVRRVLEEMEGSVQITNREGTTGTVVELEWPTLREASAGLPPAKESPVKQNSARLERTVTPASTPVRNIRTDIEALELEEDDDFETLIMQAPLIPTTPIRKPKVRTIDAP